MTTAFIPGKALLAGVALAALAIGAFLALPARDAVPATQLAACANSTTPASELRAKAVRRAVRCEINRLRAKRDRKRLRRNPRLRRVAQRHAAVMVRKECLKARCPGQPSLQRRIKRSGYIDGARRWQFAMSTGCAVNARQMVREWRKRRFHRKSMLTPRFKHLGVGTKARAPYSGCGSRTSTFTALLAWRTR